MPRLGRPRSFDRNEALASATNLFWAFGYDGVSLMDLQQAMGGITAPSFYAAFGSKEELFREVVELFSKMQGAPIARTLIEEPTARDSIKGLLRVAADSASQPGKPRGCLLLLGTMSCTSANKNMQNHLRDKLVMRQKIIHQRLQRGVAEGDIPAGVNINALTTFYMTVMDGLSVQARNGASRKALRTAVECAMAAWDPLVSQRTPAKLATTSSEVSLES